MKKIILLLTFITFSAFISKLNAQVATQDIRGVIIDKQSQSIT